MNNPLRAFEIVVPQDTDPAVLEGVQHEMEGTAGVGACGSGADRALDAATLTVWVTLAGAVVTTVGAAVPVVKQVLSLFRDRGIKGAKLRLKDGRVIEVDEISSEDLLRLAAP